MSLRGVIQTIILLLVCLYSFGQKESAVALIQQLETAQNDTARFDIYIDLSDIYARQQNDSALMYLDKAQDITERNQSATGWGQHSMGDITRNRGNFYYYKNSFVEALSYYQMAMEFYNKLSAHADAQVAKVASVSQAKLSVNMGVVYTYLGNYNKAMESYYDALRTYERVSDIEGMASCHLGVGNLLYYQQNIEPAMVSLLKAEKLYLEAKNNSGLASCVNSIGSIHFLRKNYKEAIASFNQLLNLRKELNDLQGVSTAYTNLANIYIEIEDFNNALPYLNNALEIDRNLSDTYGEAIVLGNIAQLYDKMATQPGVTRSTRHDLFERSFLHGKESFRIAEQMQVLPLVNFVADVLAKVSRSLEKYDEAKFYSSVYDNSKDSIQNEEQTKALAEIQTRYETEKKQQEINFLNRQRRKQNYLLLTVLVGLGLVLILSLFLYQLFLHKKRANTLLAQKQEQIVERNIDLLHANEEIAAQRDMVVSQKELLETIHLQLTDSLRYAQSIQAAILPPEKVLQQVSPENFVIMRPCELVSGDFFWATTINDYQVFCVADCTGHGVPGAFMSILGITALNDIVNRHRVTKPAEILGYLRESVIEALSQNDPKQLHKDGMDMALCVWNRKTQVLQYAGAGIPLWIVSEESRPLEIDSVLPPLESNGFKLYEVKNDIMPVGQSPLNDPFRNNTLNLAGLCATIYLSSDGFSDQFGAQGKFGIRRFKHLILENCHRPLLEQKQCFENAFNSWMGSSYQVDDVTVLGIRLS